MIRARRSLVALICMFLLFGFRPSFADDKCSWRKVTAVGSLYVAAAAFHVVGARFLYRAGQLGPNSTACWRDSWGGFTNIYKKYKKAIPFWLLGGVLHTLGVAGIAGGTYLLCKPKKKKIRLCEVCAQICKGDEPLEGLKKESMRKKVVN